MVALGKLEAGLKFELLGWGPDETRCQGSETWGDSADSTGVMGLRQKQLGPCLQILAPCACQSSGKSDLVPCLPEMGEEPGGQLSLQVGRCHQWDMGRGAGSLSQSDIL